MINAAIMILAYAHAHPQSYQVRTVPYQNVASILLDDRVLFPEQSLLFPTKSVTGYPFARTFCIQ